jgi:hypothetical protein
MQKRHAGLVIDEDAVENMSENTFIRRERSTLHIPFASLEDVLNFLDGTLDVVRDGVASALGRSRVRGVGALAVATSGLGKLWNHCQQDQTCEGKSLSTHCR